MKKKLLTAVFLTVFAAAGVARCNDVPPSTTKSSFIKQEVTGELISMTLDEGGSQQWMIRDSIGSMIILKGGYKPPDFDGNGTPVMPGAIVQLDCLFNFTKSTDCTPDTSSTIIVLQAIQTIPSTESIIQKLLVIIVDYPACALPANITEEEVRTIFLGPKQDGSGGVAQKYEQCSYGKLVLDRDAFRAVRVPHVCSSPVTSSCAFWAVGVLADTAVKYLIGPSNFSSFTHYTYVLPPGLQSVCRWDGASMLPGRQTWLQTNPNGIYRWATIMQKGLRNYGLWHSYRNDTEFADGSTVMGNGDACPNAAELSRLGWATPSVGGERLDSNALIAGVNKSFDLPATYLTGRNTYLRILPDWLDGYSNYARARNLYMAVRVAKDGDAALLPEFASKINIHEVNATMDNAYPYAFTYSNRRVQFIGAVGIMSKLVLNAYNLVLYGGPWVDNDVMRVYLCRFVLAPVECNPSGAQPSSPLPPSPAIVSLQPPNPPPSPTPRSPSPPPPSFSRRPPPPSPRPPPGPRPPSPRSHPSPWPTGRPLPLYSPLRITSPPPSRAPPPRRPPPPPPPPSPPNPRPPTPAPPPLSQSLPPPRSSPFTPPSPSAGSCTPLPGYTILADVDHRGDDLFCDRAISLQTAATKCSIKFECNAMSIFSVNGTAYACLKWVDGPLASSPGTCFYIRIATTCPPVLGYMASPDTDHRGDNVRCEELIQAETAASRCNSDSSCKAFNTYIADTGSSAACTKTTSWPSASSRGVCLYTKTTTNCSVITDYTLIPGADRYGDEIICERISPQTATTRCSENPDCKAFNTYTAAGAESACTQRVSGPLLASVGVCFYTKISSISCAQVPGYTLSADQDHYGDDIYCDQLSIADAIRRCERDANCQGINTWYNTTTGAFFTCAKSAVLPTSTKPGYCLYTKVYLSQLHR